MKNIHIEVLSKRTFKLLLALFVTLSISVLGAFFITHKINSQAGNYIGDLVWFDVNGDGIQSGGEPGLSGVDVTVTYYGANEVLGGGDDVIYNTTTDSSGFYYVDSLVLGNYNVQVDTGDLPTGITTNTYDLDADQDSNTDLTLDSLTPSQTEADFGYTGTGTIGDYLWYDYDGEGDQDEANAGLSNIAMQLTWYGFDTTPGGGDDLIYPVENTDSAGAYSFDNLPPGNFLVEILTPPSGGSLTTSNEPFPVTLANGETNNTADFGYRGSGSIGDLVFFDIDNNGVFGTDSNEAGANNVTLDLYWDKDGSMTVNAGDEVVGTETTDSNGAYLFDNLLYDDGGTNIFDYLVVVTDTNSVLTYNPHVSGSAGVNNNSQDETGYAVALTNIATTNDTADFGYLAGTIGGTVWFDADSDGTEDAGEPVLPNVDVDVTWHGPNSVLGGGDDVVYSLTTDSNGNFNVTSLPVDVFTVQVDTLTLTNGITNNTYDFDTDMDSHTEITLTSIANQEGSVDFGYTGTGTIGDFVWYDADGNGTQDESGTGLPNVVIALTWFGFDDTQGGGDDIAYSVVTSDADGAYSFDDLPSGEFEVAISSGLSNSILTTSNDPYPVSLPISGTDNTADFGFYGSGSIGNQVFFDLDADGTYGTVASEGGIAGVELTLYWDEDASGSVNGGDSVLNTTTTNSSSSGNYSFNNLLTNDGSGNFDYLVVVTDSGSALANYTYQAGSNPGIDNNSQDETGYALSLTPASPTDNTADFGYVAATIGDFVWFDTNNNGAQDVGEPGIPGIDVDITWYGGNGVLGGGDDVVYNRTTDSNGLYLLIEAPLGNYSVEVDTGSLPSGLSTNTFDLDSDFDSEAEVTLTIGVPVEIDMDFGYIGSGAIGDYVWYDIDGEGDQDEIGTANTNAQVGLTWFGVDGVLGGGDDMVFANIATDASGYYQFQNLPAGNFEVTVPVAPFGGQLTTANLPLALTLTPGETNNTADFGYLGSGQVGGTVFYDQNNNGILDISELDTGISGIDLDLYWDLDENGAVDGSDILIGTQTTGADGNYVFTDLPADNGDGNTEYIVSILDSSSILNSYQYVVGPNPGVDNNSQDESGYTVTLSTVDDTDTTGDFGYLAGSIVGNIFGDKDSNGSKDSDEDGIAGVEVTLWSDDDKNGTPNNIIEKVYTDANGDYRFVGLPLICGGGDCYYFMRITDGDNILAEYSATGASVLGSSTGGVGEEGFVIVLGLSSFQYTVQSFSYLPPILPSTGFSMVLNVIVPIVLIALVTGGFVIGRRKVKKSNTYVLNS